MLKFSQFLAEFTDFGKTSMVQNLKRPKVLSWNKIPLTVRGQIAQLLGLCEVRMQGSCISRNFWLENLSFEKIFAVGKHFSQILTKPRRGRKTLDLDHAFYRDMRKCSVESLLQLYKFSGERF